MRTPAWRVFDKETWHPCFAWRPHRIQFRSLAPNGEAHPNVRLWVWLEPLERRRESVRTLCDLYEYRLPQENAVRQ